MNHFLRPYRSVGFVLLAGMSAGMIAVPGLSESQSTQMVELLQGTSPLLLHGSSQGYLGVWVDDVDADKAQVLKLKDVRGAVITLIDHDAPAGQIGLHVNDVVLQLNGQNVEGAEQLRRMLREIPPGRKVSLEFSRDGNLQTTSVQLVDRRAMEHDVWNKLDHGSDSVTPATGMGVLPGGGDAPLPGMFHVPIFGSTLNVGAMVEPLAAQTAEYLGVPSGLMVKGVTKKSEAYNAGFKVKDVILKVGAEAVTTLADWDRALRSNQGKPVPVTILRDGKQQTLTLQVDSKHKTGELQREELFPAGDCQILAELEPDLAQIAGDNQQLAEALRDEAQELKDQIQKSVQSGTSSQQAEELRRQAEKFRESFNADNFKIDQKQLDELKKQMNEWQKKFGAAQFQIDQKQLDGLKKQMEQFRKDWKPQDLQVAPN